MVAILKWQNAVLQGLLLFVPFVPFVVKKIIPAVKISKYALFMLKYACYNVRFDYDRLKPVVETVIRVMTDQNPAV